MQGANRQMSRVGTRTRTHARDNAPDMPIIKRGLPRIAQRGLMLRHVICPHGVSYAAFAPQTVSGSMLACLASASGQARH